MDRDRQRASDAPFIFAMFVPSTSRSPDVGWSTPPIRFKSVVLPEPEGPMSATNAPSGIDSDSPSSTRNSSVCRRYSLTTLRTSTDAIVHSFTCATSVGRELHLAAVLQTRRRREHQALAAQKSLPHLGAIAARRSDVDRLLVHEAVLHDPHDRVAVRLHDRRLRHEYAPRRGRDRPVVRFEHDLGA